MHEKIVCEKIRKTATLSMSQSCGATLGEKMKPSPVVVTKFINGVAQTQTVHTPTQSGYILCVNDAGVSGYPDRVARRSTSLATIAAAWFDLGGEGGNARIYHANGDALSPRELAAARKQLGEMA